MTTLTRYTAALLMLLTLSMGTACATMSGPEALTSTSTTHATSMAHDHEADGETCVTPHELNALPVILR